MEGKLETYEGMENLVSVLEELFGEDEITETFVLYKEFVQKTRNTGQDMLEYTIEWETLYNKVKSKGIILPDKSFNVAYDGEHGGDDTKLGVVGAGHVIK